VKTRILLIMLLAVMMAACATSGPRISVNSNPESDLTAFRTFGFLEPLGTDRSGARTQLSTMLVRSMEREMTAHGLVQSDSPDLLVDFFVTTEERLDVRQSPSSSMSMHRTHRSHWNSWNSTWPSYSTTVRQYTEGTLLIDLIDPAANVLVAEGAAQSRLRGNEMTQQQIDDVVSQVMTEMMGR
jgi:hypothetical protein